MSRKKRRNRDWTPAPAPQPATPAVPLSSVPAAPAAVTGNLNFDSQEARIRGDEIMMQEESKKATEVRNIKKQLDDIEVERRLNELRKQLGLKK